MNRAKLALWRARYNYRRKKLDGWEVSKQRAEHFRNAKAKARAENEIVKWGALVGEAARHIHGLEEKAKPAVSQIVMYDSISLSEFPPNPEAVAGYTSGSWPTYVPLTKKFPKAHHLSIAVNASHDAQCLDIEAGDATPAQAPAWVRKQHQRGVQRPAVYGSISSMASIIRTLETAGIPRSQFKTFTAHYTFKKHRCTSACGFGFTGTADATQWTDKALGRNLDESLTSGDFFS